MKHDHLWDPSGEPDPELARLERALRPYRWSGELPPDEALEERPPVRRRPRTALLVALAAMLLVALGLALWRGARPGAQQAGPYRLQVLAGEPRFEGRGAGGVLSPGQALVLDEDARVELSVGDIGRVEVGPSSRLRIGEPATEGSVGARYLLHLERGSLAASIFAAPRLFQLGTPAGIAVDLGCVYTARVDEGGATRLSVTLGLVAFETEGRKVVVPSGASTLARPGERPGTPAWDDAPQEFRDALARLDAGGPLRAADLERVLATEAERDSLTLWHLLDDPRDEVRAKSFERLAALVPPPRGVTREGCLTGDREMLERWRDAMSWDW